MSPEDIVTEYKALNKGDAEAALLALAYDAVEALGRQAGQVSRYYAACSKAYLREKARDEGPVRIDAPADPITDDWIRTGVGP
ncbi:hypothetical protein [Microvirga alba]|uniref:Uncharacterized protein n=1 Tax=Microvirga alba TaxID=2791025 RepID=A0A931BRF2_9HYPH|nr:hypothetical protein [Microvirga alba]MBF9234673.1 hypothetical protein [Microvirga alba]